MSIANMPLFAVLRTKMQWHQSRQKLLAENVANADMPGFKPRDLRTPSFPDALGAASVSAGGTLPMAVTSPLHIGNGGGAGGSGDPRNGWRFETTGSGNAVNLEEEMLKVAQNQTDYQTATSLYAKSLGLLRMAVGKR
ncbi:MAG: flagellar basal body rod protein FlgB [Beijerinckiaceae bacterium]